jgi:hypothetical protein
MQGPRDRIVDNSFPSESLTCKSVRTSKFLNPPVCSHQSEPPRRLDAWRAALTPAPPLDVLQKPPPTTPTRPNTPTPGKTLPPQALTPSPGALLPFSCSAPPPPSFPSPTPRPLLLLLPALRRRLPLHSSVAVLSLSLSPLLPRPALARCRSAVATGRRWRA